MQRDATLGELLRGVELATGEAAVVEVSTVGDLHVELRDAYGHGPLDDATYEAKGPEGSLSGRTDEHGRLRHRKIKAGTYEITVKDLKIQATTKREAARPQVRWLAHHRAKP